MRRNEVLLNLTLLIVIGALVFLMYESRELPRTLDELEAPVVTAPAAGAKASAKKSGKRGGGTTTGTAQLSGDADTDDAEAGAASKAPGTETTYAAGKDKPRGKTGASDKKTTASSSQTTGTEVAMAGDDATQGEFGRRNIFRALLTPTPTPPPPTPTPAPTPDIKQALGAWRLLSVYQGKAMFEDVKMSAEEAEGAIWEMSQGGSKQVDAGNGIMKTATLKKIDNENPYNPEVIFSLEGTTAEHKINLDTEPVVAPAAPKPK